MSPKNRTERAFCNVAQAQGPDKFYAFVTQQKEKAPRPDHIQPSVRPSVRATIPATTMYVFSTENSFLQQVVQDSVFVKKKLDPITATIYRMVYINLWPYFSHFLTDLKKNSIIKGVQVVSPNDIEFHENRHSKSHTSLKGVNKFLTLHVPQPTSAQFSKVDLHTGLSGNCEFGANWRREDWRFLRTKTKSHLTVLYSM